MNTFKRKSLYAALLSVGALGVTGAADAVNVNPNGLGQVLIYPYYTVRADALINPFNSLLSVVNTTSSVQVVKVRFLEGKDSREVLDFNLFLSAFDVWTASITPNAAGGGHLATNDHSCTIPAIPPGGKDFVNFAYVGSNSDKGGDSLDRTKEGYVEIIGMASFSDGSTVASLATHVAGVPPCGITDSLVFQTSRDFPLGGLFGGISLVNVLSGDLYTEDAVAIDNFTQSEIYDFAGYVTPDLTAANPPVSSVIYTPFLGSDPFVINSTWAGGNADPVSAVLMHDSVMNEFVLDTGAHASTDWVLTMPTKRFYINIGTGNAPRLFQRNFNQTVGACDDVGLDLFDREEFSAPGSFSPPPPTQTNALCWEANVVTFNNGNVLGSANVTNIPTGFQNGWARISFPFSSNFTVVTPHKLINVTNTVIVDGVTGGISRAQTVTYFGLPVVGFAVQNFINGTLSTTSGPAALIQSNYGGNFVQKGSLLIE